MTWWQATLISIAAVLAIWLVLLLAVSLTSPDRGSLLDGVRVLPDTLRLVRRLAADPTVPRSSRWWLWVLLVYLASPIDLIPDFVPVLGYADDLILASLVLRHLIRRAGPESIQRHWSGTPEGLATLRRLLRIDAGAP